MEQARGVLSVLGGHGYPYGIPLDHWYSESDGRLYFHGAKEGHKLDAIRACDKVSYCVYDEGYLEKEMKNAFPRVCCLELEIEHMTGKLVNES